ncbi:MAG: hypothetical protein U5L95_03730 [Candidatus Saccharibacteria bacterium]|nr:hypothetical protein [Candidatus Saccharibacteria bacterium]
MHLEQFSRLKSPVQAHHAHDVVWRSADMLEVKNPGALERYATYNKSLRHVTRLAGFGEGFQGYLAKEQEGIHVPAIGMVTVILGQTASYLDERAENGEGSVHGATIDYWLEPGKEAMHQAMGERVIGEANNLLYRHCVEAYKDEETASRALEHADIFTVEPDIEAVPPGFRPYVRPILPEPAEVEHTRGNRHFDIVPEGDAQIFVVEKDNLSV